LGTEVLGAEEKVIICAIFGEVDGDMGGVDEVCAFLWAGDG